jgi:hypothetical protein
MEIIEYSREVYGKWFKIVLVWCLFATIIFDSMEYVSGVKLYPSDFHKITWGTEMLQGAIENLQKGLGVNVLIAVPQILVSVGLIVVQVLLNSILLINYIIAKIIYIMFILCCVPESTASAVSGILAWILEAPLILGVVSILGNIIFSFLSFNR